MKCPVCELEVAAGTWECPTCGDHLGQWQELDTLAQGMYQAGLTAAGEDDLIHAILFLNRATILQPENALAHLALGKALADSGCRDEAAYHLKRCAALAEFSEPQEHEAANQALARLATDERQGKAPALLNLGEIISTHETDADKECPTQTGAIDPWGLVTSLESDWRHDLAALIPLLSLCRPDREESAGALAYLKGLARLANGDADAARDSFRDSIAADATRPFADVYLFVLSSASGEGRDAAEYLLKHGRAEEDVMRRMLLSASVLQQRGETNGRNTLLTDGIAVMTGREESDTPELNYLIGRALHELGRQQEARTRLEKAARADVPHTEAQALLAEISECAKDSAEAS